MEFLDPVQLRPEIAFKYLCPFCCGDLIKEEWYFFCSKCMGNVSHCSISLDKKVGFIYLKSQNFKLDFSFNTFQINIFSPEDVLLANYKNVYDYTLFSLKKILEKYVKMKVFT